MRKVKMAVQDFFNKVRYLFRPAKVIVTCLGLAAGADLMGVLLICFVFQEGTAYDVILALITGVTASAVVSVIIEMANNYQRNSKRWLFLAPLYSTLMHYSSDLAISTGHYDANKSHVDFVTQIHQNLAAKGQETEEEAAAAIERASAAFADDEEMDEEWRRDHDRIRCVFSRLPDMIPQIEDACRAHADVLSRAELDAMDEILMTYRQIEDIVKMKVRQKARPLVFANPKASGVLVTWLPTRVKRRLGKSILLTLALEEREAEAKRIAETLMRHGENGLDDIGIELSEKFVDDSDDAPCGRTQNASLSRAVSTMVSKIDHELLKLQKMVEVEPGFGPFFSFMKEAETPYLR